jgi:hypothetical protein
MYSYILLDLDDVLIKDYYIPCLQNEVMQVLHLLKEMNMILILCSHNIKAKQIL